MKMLDSIPVISKTPIGPFETRDVDKKSRYCMKSRSELRAKTRPTNNPI